MTLCGNGDRLPVIIPVNMMRLFAKRTTPSDRLPTRLAVGVVIALCIAILASAVFTYATFLRLRSSYLANRGREISAAIEAQARGPGRRNNPAFWQTLLESAYETYSGSVASLALVDHTGKVLASAGDTPRDDGDLYIFEEPLPQPRSPHSEARPAVAGWKIRVGLQLSETDFIKRQATLQLVVSGLAVVALFALSMTLLRMLSRFLELKMREGEEKQLKSLGIMAASLAHEIRNPIGAMKGLTQLAQEDLPPDHSAQPQLKTVVSEAERLEKLVTDLLDFAHAREPQIREFQLSDVIAGITTMVQPRLEASNVALRISATFDSPIRSDPDGLKQVLLNTIMNAIEATPPGGTVELKAFDGNNDDLVVQIDDSGKGLGESSPNELFEPFTTKKARGTGLGLAVSKQIMDRLHGSLELENLPQGGARCSIRIPRLPSGADK